MKTSLFPVQGVDEFDNVIAPLTLDDLAHFIRCQIECCFLVGTLRLTITERIGDLGIIAVFRSQLREIMLSVHRHGSHLTGFLVSFLDRAFRIGL